MCEYAGGKPVCGMKVKVFCLQDAEVGGLCSFVSQPALSTDHDSLMKDSSVSIDVGTRKMVNYA